MKFIKLSLVAFVLLASTQVFSQEISKQAEVEANESQTINLSSKEEPCTANIGGACICSSCVIPPPSMCWVDGHWALWGGLPYWISGHYKLC